MDDFDLRPARDLGLAPLERLRSVRRESGPVLTACHFAWALGTRAYFKLWHGLAVHDRHHLPAEPPFVLCAITPATSTRWPWPPRSRSACATGCSRWRPGTCSSSRPSRRRSPPGSSTPCRVWWQAADPAGPPGTPGQLVETPCGFILFPEGARSRDGKYLKFKSGIGMLVAGTDVPVVPCHLSGTLDALPAGCKVPRRRRIAGRGWASRSGSRTCPNLRDGPGTRGGGVEQRIRAGRGAGGAGRGQGANARPGTRRRVRRPAAEPRTGHESPAGARPGGGVRPTRTATGRWSKGNERSPSAAHRPGRGSVARTFEGGPHASRRGFLEATGVPQGRFGVSCTAAAYCPAERR